MQNLESESTNFFSFKIPNEIDHHLEVGLSSLSTIESDLLFTTLLQRKSNIDLKIS